MNKLTHKEMAKHIRGRLQASGVPARVKMNDFCGQKMISVVTPSFEFRWSPDQLRTIGICAQVNQLTLSRSMPISVEVIEQLVGSTQHNFEFHGL